MYLSSGPENIEKFFGNSTFNGTIYNLDFTNAVSTSSPLSLFLSFLSLSLIFSPGSLFIILPSPHNAFFVFLSLLSAAIGFENRPLCCFHHPQCLRRFPVPGTVQLRHHHHTGTQHHRMELMRERKKEREERKREREKERERKRKRKRKWKRVLIVRGEKWGEGEGIWRSLFVIEIWFRRVMRHLSTTLPLRSSITRMSKSSFSFWRTWCHSKTYRWLLLNFSAKLSFWSYFSPFLHRISCPFFPTLTPSS